MFSNEESLVQCFVQHLQSDSSPWGSMKFETEFFYQRGRTDLIGVVNGDNIIAFEAKLQRWKSALQQAYRNKCFADNSYVILPNEHAIIAAQYEVEFRRRGIGLCGVSSDEITILFESAQNEPLQPWLKKQALVYIGTIGGEDDFGSF